MYFQPQWKQNGIFFHFLVKKHRFGIIMKKNIKRESSIVYSVCRELCSVGIDGQLSPLSHDFSRKYHAALFETVDMEPISLYYLCSLSLQRVRSALSISKGPGEAAMHVHYVDCDMCGTLIVLEEMVDLDSLERRKPVYWALCNHIAAKLYKCVQAGSSRHLSFSPISVNKLLRINVIYDS